jgi:UDP-N-acetyl-D-glucosamine dehydrogenase
VQDALNDLAKAMKGSRILVLGASYKPDIDDLRESPALDVIGLLMAKGALVEYHDPFIPELRHDTWVKTSVPDLKSAVKAVDCVVIVTNHSQYDYQMVLDNANLIVDTRNAMNKVGNGSPKVVKL